MLFNSHEYLRRSFTNFQAMGAIVQGQDGFFVPRLPPLFPWAERRPEQASLYDTSQLKSTLLRLCDFDRIN
ncbi:patatin-like phospholipase family protein, partial [Burkholderia sp. SIMBA_048]